MPRLALVAAALVTCAATAEAQSARAALDSVPDLAPLVAQPASELADVVDRFSSDLGSLRRRYDADGSPAQRTRMREFHRGWRSRLSRVDFNSLGQEGKVDYVLLDNYLRHQLVLLERADALRAGTAPLIPFADRLLALQDARRDLKTINSSAAAATLAAATKQADSLRALVESPPPRGADGPVAGASQATAPKVSRTVANRAADQLDDIRSVVANWYKYYDAYDPQFTWWNKDPYKRLDESLTRYARTLRERVVGFKPADAQSATAATGARGGGSDANLGPIIGDPIGAKGLAEDLRYEMIDYTPEELIAIAQREYAFSLGEMKKASRAMGYGDDWKAAMEKVKDTYVEPGKQRDLIRDLARQAAISFSCRIRPRGCRRKTS